MPRFEKPISRRLAIASALLAALPGVILAQQQDKPGVALPPPSLYDSEGVPLPPPSRTQPAPTVTPSWKKPSPSADQTKPPAAEPAKPTAAVQPAPPPQTAPKPESQAVAKPEPKPAPKPEPVEVKPLPPQPGKEERALEPEPARAPVAAEPAPKPVPAKETVTLSADTVFSLNSAAIKSTAREELDAFLAKMKGMDYESIVIIGHTDPTGSATHNTTLSRQRAESVKRYFVAKGMDPKKIEAQGLGNSKPVVTGIDCSKLPRAAKIVCFQPDRRVEIEVTGAVPKMTGRN